MITFFNRREVYSGVGLQRFNRVRDILDAYRIKYNYKYGNLASFSIVNQPSEQCYVYVHKKDYEKANDVLRDVWR